MAITTNTSRSVNAAGRRYEVISRPFISWNGSGWIWETPPYGRRTNTRMKLCPELPMGKVCSMEVSLAVSPTTTGDQASKSEDSIKS